MQYSHADLSEQDEEAAGGWQSNESKVSSVTLPTTMWTSGYAIVLKQTQARFNANARTDNFIDGVIDVKWPIYFVVDTLFRWNLPAMN